MIVGSPYVSLERRKDTRPFPRVDHLAERQLETLVSKLRSDYELFLNS